MYNKKIFILLIFVNLLCVFMERDAAAGYWTRRKLENGIEMIRTGRDLNAMDYLTAVWVEGDFEEKQIAAFYLHWMGERRFEKPPTLKELKKRGTAYGFKINGPAAKPSGKRVVKPTVVIYHTSLKPMGVISAKKAADKKSKSGRRVYATDLSRRYRNVDRPGPAVISRKNENIRPDYKKSAPAREGQAERTEQKEFRKEVRRESPKEVPKETRKETPKETSKDAYKDDDDDDAEEIPRPQHVSSGVKFNSEGDKQDGEQDVYYVDTSNVEYAESGSSGLPEESADVKADVKKENKPAEFVETVDFGPVSTVEEPQVNVTVVENKKQESAAMDSDRAENKAPSGPLADIKVKEVTASVPEIKEEGGIQKGPEVPIVVNAEDKEFSGRGIQLAKFEPAKRDLIKVEDAGFSDDGSESESEEKVMEISFKENDMSMPDDLVNAVEGVGKILSKNSDEVIVRGFSSPMEINPENIAKVRAKLVEKILRKKGKVSASRISVEWGVGINKNDQRVVIFK